MEAVQAATSEKVCMLEKQLVESKEKGEAAADELHDLRRENETLEDRVRAMLRQQVSLAEKHKAKMAELNANVSSLKQLNQEVLHKKAQLKIQYDSFSKASEDYHDLESKHAVLKSRFLEASHLAESKQRECDALSKTVSNLEVSNGKLESELKHAKEDRDAKTLSLRASEEAKYAAESRAEVLDAELKSLSKLKDSLQDSLKHRTNELVARSKELQSVTSKSRSLQRSLASSEEEKKSAQAKLRTSNADLEAALVELASAKDKAASASQASTRLCSEVKELNDRCTEYDVKISDIASALDEANEVADATRTKLMVAERALKAETARANEAERQKEIEMEIAKTSRSELLSVREERNISVSELLAFKERVTTAKLQLEQKRDECDELSKEYAAYKGKMEIAYADTSAALKDAVKTSAESDSRVKALVKRARVFEEKSADDRVAIASLEAKLVAATSESARSKDEAASLSRKVVVAEKAAAQAEETINSMRKAHAASDRERLRLQNKLTEVSTSLDAAQEQLARNARRIDSLDEAKERLSGEMQGMQVSHKNEVEALERALAEAKVQGDNSLQGSLETLRETQNKLESIAAEELQWRAKAMAREEECRRCATRQSATSLLLHMSGSIFRMKQTKQKCMRAALSKRRKCQSTRRVIVPRAGSFSE